MQSPIYWSGNLPACVTCEEFFSIEEGTRMYDARTDQGPWANMCTSCFHLGPGLGRTGPGFGQEYTRQANGRWLKTGG